MEKLRGTHENRESLAQRIFPRLRYNPLCQFEATVALALINIL